MSPNSYDPHHHEGDNARPAAGSNPIESQPAIFRDTDFSGRAAVTGADQRVRQLLGLSVFRDPTVQIEERLIFDNLCKEFRATTVTQTLLVSTASRLSVQLRQLYSTVETAVSRKRADAARVIIDSRFSAFFPPPAGALETSGLSETAYGSYMRSGGKAVLDLPDSEAIVRAIALLAKEGLPESALDEHARILALPEIEKLERIIAAKLIQLEGLFEQMLRLLDRLRKFNSNANS